MRAVRLHLVSLERALHAFELASRRGERALAQAARAVVDLESALLALALVDEEDEEALANAAGARAGDVDERRARWTAALSEAARRASAAAPEIRRLAAPR